MTYIRCGWYFCPNHLADHEHGTHAARWWRRNEQGAVHSPEHAWLLDTPKRVKAGAR